MKMRRKELIQLLYSTPISRRVENQWHARISNGVKKGKLPNTRDFYRNEFLEWAHKNYVEILAAGGQVTLARGNGVSAPCEVGQVLVATNIPPVHQNTPPTERQLISELTVCQLALHREQLAHAATKKELDRLNEHRKKSSDAGKRGGRGNSL
jgi:hypothetical protein